MSENPVTDAEITVEHTQQTLEAARAGSSFEEIPGVYSTPSEVDASAVPVVDPSAAHTKGVRQLSLNISRDEMNLAEFPLAVLSKRSDPSVKTLEFSDVVKGKNGDTVNRKWIITGADKFGLPTSSDDEVLLGLLKLTADEGLKSRKIHFTRYELLKILRWTTEGRSYTRLQNALDRLSGVRIKATNAFYDNESKLHSTRNFGIIDAYEINDGRDTRPSFFTWSEVLFKSFQVGFIKKLDLEFYLDLQSAVSKRLYRYLDKHFWYRSRIQVNLFILAHEKIGISRNYVYASSLRQQLEPALDELKEKGMLSSYEFIGKGKSTEVVLLAATAPRRTLPPSATTSAVCGSTTAFSHVTTDGQVAPTHASTNWSDETDSAEGPRILVRELAARGIAEKQAQRLVEGQGSEVLSRIAAILSHFDALIASSSHLVSKNPAGFLYRAVERPLEFTLPSDKFGSHEKKANRVTTAATTSQRNAQESFTFKDRVAHGGAPNRSQQRPSLPATKNVADLEVDYLRERGKALAEARATVTSAELSALESDVEVGLAKIRAHISPQRFTEAVTRGVDQKVLDMQAFPSFDEWSKRRK